MADGGRVKFSLDMDTGDFYSGSQKAIQITKQLEKELNLLSSSAKTAKKALNNIYGKEVQSMVRKTTDLLRKQAGIHKSITKEMNRQKQAMAGSKGGAGGINPARMQGLLDYSRDVGARSAGGNGRRSVNSTRRNAGVGAGAYVLGGVADSAASSIMNFTNQAVESFRSIKENLSAINYTFGQGAFAKSMEGWAKSNASRFNARQDDMTGALSNMGGIMKSQGFNVESEGKDAQMLRALITRGADVGSMKNLDFSKVMERMTSAIFNNQTKAGHSLGTSLGVADMEKFMKEKGIAGKYRDLAMNEKIQLRADKFMKDTSGTKGDLNRTKNSSANIARNTEVEMYNQQLIIAEKLDKIMLNVHQKMLGIYKMITGGGAGWASWIIPLAGVLKVISMVAKTMTVMASAQEIISGSKFGIAGAVIGVGAAIGTGVLLNNMLNATPDTAAPTTGIEDTTMLNGASGATSSNPFAMQTNIVMDRRTVGKATSTMAGGTAISNNSYS